MSELHCAECSTPYLAELGMCPHCGSTAFTEGDVVVSRRLPLLVSVACICGLGPWQLRLPVVQTGLVQLPELHCASCGRQVQIPWPPAEDEMPKITRHGGATNARETDPSPAVDASQPLVGAEADQGRPTSAEGGVVSGDGVGEALEEFAPQAYAEDAVPLPVSRDYDGMTLAELREEANGRGLPSYGSKAQIIDRLRGADA